MKIFFGCFLLIFAYPFASKGQTLDEAKEWYKQGKYAQAKPIFENELQAKPADPALNLWYGVCVLQSGGSKNLAESHIRLAAQKAIPDACLYLGDILTQKYCFSQALAEYDKFLRLKKKDKASVDLIAQRKAKIEEYTKWLRRSEDVQIIDSVVVNKSKFLTAYKLSKQSGRLTTFNELSDTKEKVDATGYINEKGTKIYYSQLAGDGVFSLYSMEKLLDQYGNEKLVSPTRFGMKGDQNYPFVLTDGVTLYFAAKDEDTMGGYDLFVTRYNLDKDSYLTPERLNMPFNSLYNDYMLVIDEDKGVGWFASDRFQPEGKVCIYTFIPNDQVKSLEIASLDSLAMRARISSIRDTWKKGKDYSSLIEAARRAPVEKVEVKADFDFVINDLLVYHHLNSFRSSEARQLFVQLQKLQLNLSEKENELEALRDSYSKGDKDSKRQLTQQILILENEVENLKTKQRELTIHVRNTEIKALVK